MVRLLVVLGQVGVCLFWLSGISPHVVAADETEIWTTAQASVGGYQILSIDRPTTDWSVTPFQHRGKFVQFFRFFPLADEAVWFSVQMMHAPVREEITHDAVAQGLKTELANEPTTTGEVVLEPVVVDGVEASRLRYTTQNDAGQAVWHVDVILITEATWFLLSYEAPTEPFVPYEPTFERILASVKLAREALRQFWKESWVNP